MADSTTTTLVLASGMSLPITTPVRMMEFGSFLVNFFMKARTLVGSEKRFAAARGHRELVAALRARDAQTAKAVMVAHIGTWQPHKDD